MIARFRALVRRRRFERSLDAELRFHLDQQIDENVAAGMSPEEAVSAARRTLGSTALVREQCRDSFGLTLVDEFRQDVRHAVRVLASNRGFTTVATLTLALGLGASTAVFSLIDAVRTGALPYRDPERLVQVFGNISHPRVARRGASYPDFLDWRAHTTSVADIAAFDPQKLTVTGGDEPERLDTEYVSASYFSVLEVTPAHGRTFHPDEDQISHPASVVVISDRLWKRRFGADPRVVGRTIAVSGRPFPTYTVIGVMPPGFRGVTDAAELWMPFAQWAPPRIMTDRGQRWLTAVARLKADSSLAAAQQELRGISERLEREYPETNRHRAAEVSPLHVEVFGPLRSVLRTLMVAVALVWLIACANVANLLVVRSDARRRETAVRRALGAGRTRLLRQLVTENSVLTALASVAGLGLAQLALTALLPRSPVPLPSFVTPAVSLRVAAFSIAASLICGLLVSVAPGLQLRGSDLHALEQSTRTSRGRRSRRLRHAVIVAEVSLALVLLVGAGLVIRSVRNTANIAPGFEATQVLTLHASILRVPVPGSSQGSTRPAVEGRVLLEHIRAVPGVIAAALGNDLPLDGNGVATFYAAESQAIDPRNPPRGYLHRVSREFFATLHIPIVRGRTFSADEMTPTAPVVMVSERLAQQFWSGRDPVGQRLQLEPQRSGSPWLTIVGIVGEVKYRGLPDNPDMDPDLYVPFLDRNSQIALAVRTATPPASLARAVTDAVRRASASIVPYDIAPMSDRVAAQSATARFVMWLMSVFGAIALSLAAIGLYGVMSYVVSQRTREIGIRTALGATNASIMWFVLSGNVVLIGIGLLVGLAGATVFGRYLQGTLFDVPAFDPPTVTVALLILGVIGIIASYVPARRATTIDPLIALRQE